jgi:hypothetical protein
LAEVLVGEPKREPVATCLGEQVLEGAGEREVVVYLVDVEGAVAPLRFRLAAAGENLLPDPRHQ